MRRAGTGAALVHATLGTKGRHERGREDFAVCFVAQDVDLVQIRS